VTRWQIPEPLPVGWTMRSLDSATVTAGFLADGRFRQRIEHAPLPGVTPAMCLWYLERAGTQVSWRGIDVLAYWLWHPRDHIFFQRQGTFGPGDSWRIVEAFGAGRRFLLDGIFHVTKLDDTGFTMELRLLGRPVAVMDERWQPGDQGLSWTVEMTVGSAAPGLRPFVRARVRSQMAFLERWRRHNVEEAGNLQHFLPELHAETC
jgi:hypothetical protein